MRRRVAVTCERCAATFEVPRSQTGRRKFCSMECRSGARMLACECVQCGVTFAVPRSTARKGAGKFCSRTCKHQNMDRGITAEHRKVRASAEYRAWRTAVFERDDYTCQHCGVHGGYLEADHIQSFAAHPDLRFSVENGRTLCQPCHRATPTFGGRTRVPDFAKGY